MKCHSDSPFKTGMACNHWHEISRIASQGAMPSWINWLNLPKHHLGSCDWHLVVMTIGIGVRWLELIPLNVRLTASWGDMW